MFKIIRFFNSQIPHNQNKNHKYIWVNLSHEINSHLKYYQKYHKDTKIEVESVFKSFITNDKKISFFDNKNKIKKHRKISKVFLYAQSDTLANSCNILYNELKNHFETTLLFPCYKDEKAEEFFKHHNLPAKKFSYQILKQEKPDLFILLNDWSKEAIRIISLCRILKIPTICLQESIIDFGDKTKRMLFADYVFVQGTQTTINLERSLQFITGNPRYILNQDNQRIDKTDLLINCNFTYNIFEEVREKWIHDITSIANEEGLSFKISQHPRDKGDLSMYKDLVIKSDSSSVEQQISESKIIITRFSSLIHEAILQKKYVIYYNPHKESMLYNFRFNNKFLFHAENKEALKKILKHIQLNNSSNFEKQIWEQYIISHMMPLKKPSTLIIKDLLDNYQFKSTAVSFKDFLRICIYNPSLLKLYRSVKKYLTNKD